MSSKTVRNLTPAELAVVQAFWSEATDAWRALKPGKSPSAAWKEIGEVEVNGHMLRICAPVGDAPAEEPDDQGDAPPPEAPPSSPPTQLPPPTESPLARALAGASAPSPTPPPPAPPVEAAASTAAVSTAPDEPVAAAPIGAEEAEAIAQEPATWTAAWRGARGLPALRATLVGKTDAELERLWGYIMGGQVKVPRFGDSENDMIVNPRASWMAWDDFAALIVSRGAGGKWIQRFVAR